MVLSVGVTGLTTKHSPVLTSLDPEMPLSGSPLKVACQQYRPAEVIQALDETTVTG